MRVRNGVVAGQSLQQVCRAPDAPCVGTVYNWMRADPAFVQMYLAAKAAGFYRLACEAARSTPWRGGERRSLRRLEKVEDVAHRRCAQLAPKRYAPGTYEAEPRRKLDWP